MQLWWGKYSKKAKKASIIRVMNQKVSFASEEKGRRSGASTRHCSVTFPENEPHFNVNSTLVSHSLSFSHTSCAQPLPVTGGHSTTTHGLDGKSSRSKKSGSEMSCRPSLLCSFSHPGHIADEADYKGDGMNVRTATVAANSSSDSGDPSGLRILSPQVSNHEYGSKTAINSPSSLKQKDQSPVPPKQSSRDTFKPPDLLLHNQTTSTSAKCPLLSLKVSNAQNPPFGDEFSALDISMSSPSRSPRRVMAREPAMMSGFGSGKPHADISLESSGHCSSNGSGCNSCKNSVGGDVSGQIFRQNSRCSCECSPTLSPRMASPGPCSRVNSGAVTPLHPRMAGTSSGYPMAGLADGKQQSYRLPLPPVKDSNPTPCSPLCTKGSNFLVSRSPGRTENVPSTGPKFKKGKLLGRGTFGQVYAGFDSERGEMCAMKEVTLLADDPKSRESAQQLGQEISLLSQLRHPNIVQYYGSERVDDKLYIYLELVAGGSLHKFLQIHGPFGEAAVQSFTKQVLSGLAYLHAKNTVHRDVKAANILLDRGGHVKLADFGMAKHITGQPGPLSFKGSPYWIAPEVITNSNADLAVDIWSLGCTVIEMATSKPPWSQYEGVAAMFKIGTSNELPPMPDNLSEEGKDFIRKCLQRNPSQRPTAAQLLEHPFVKYVIPSEYHPQSPETVEAMNCTGSQGTAQSINPSYVDHGDISLARGSKTVTGDVHTPRNITCPLSPPVGSPPPLIYCTHGASASLTPVPGGNGVIEFHRLPQLPQQKSERLTRSPESGACGASGSLKPVGGDYGVMYHHPRSHQQMMRGRVSAPPISSTHCASSSSTPIAGRNGAIPVSGDPKEQQTLCAQSVLADQLSRQLHLKHNATIDLIPRSSVHGRDIWF